MKILEDFIPTMTIEEFAEKHNLVMVVKERGSSLMRMPHIGRSGRFYAEFENSEIKGDGVLIGVFGNGPTPKDAISDYARHISERRLVLKAWNKSERREIEVPRLMEQI